MEIDHFTAAEAQRRDAAEMGTARRFPPLSPADLDADYRAYKGPWAHPTRMGRDNKLRAWVWRFCALFLIAFWSWIIVMLAAAGVAWVAGGDDSLPVHPAQADQSR